MKTINYRNLTVAFDPTELKLNAWPQRVFVGSAEYTTENTEICRGYSWQAYADGVYVCYSNADGSKALWLKKELFWRHK